VFWEVTVSITLSKECICTCVIFRTVSELQLLHTYMDTQASEHYSAPGGIICMKQKYIIKSTIFWYITLCSPLKANVWEEHVASIYRVEK
jgi:hypothetical protein